MIGEAYLWEAEWGGRLSILLKVQERTGRTPDALRDMPSLPFYYEEILQHFYVLSRSRSYFAEIVPTKTGGMYTVRRPNPIAISTIIDYNHNIAKILKDSDFLDIIQSLDLLFMTNAYKKR